MSLRMVRSLATVTTNKTVNCFVGFMLYISYIISVYKLAFHVFYFVAPTQKPQFSCFVVRQPILPIRSRVLFPHCSLQVNVGMYGTTSRESICFLVTFVLAYAGRPKSIKLIESLLRNPQGSTLKRKGILIGLNDNNSLDYTIDLRVTFHVHIHPLSTTRLHAGVVTCVPQEDDKEEDDKEDDESVSGPKIFESRGFYCTGVTSEITSLRKRKDSDSTTNYKYVMTLKGVQVCLPVRVCGFPRYLGMFISAAYEPYIYIYIIYVWTLRGWKSRASFRMIRSSLVASDCLRQLSRLPSSTRSQWNTFGKRFG